METIYKNATEAAKGIRAELKAKFPGVKFSVKTSYFAGGDSIRISWNLGPTDKAVSAVTDKYAEGRFDGATDASWSEDTLVSCPDGDVKILGGAKFVHTNRTFEATVGDYASETAFWTRVQRDLCALQGVEYVDGTTNFYGRQEWSYDEQVVAIARRVVANLDLTAGYHGLRRADNLGNYSIETAFAVEGTK